jgi:hypothetical protein
VAQRSSAAGPAVEKRGAEIQLIEAQPNGEQRLTNERVVFAADDLAWFNENKIPQWLQVRLSPDGKKLLYVRPVDSIDRPARQSFALLIRDTVTGRDASVPVPPYLEGSEDVGMRFDPFDPNGARMALSGPDMKQVFLVDVAKQTAAPMGGEGVLALALFDRTGNRLIGHDGTGLCVVDARTFERTPLATPDVMRAYPHSVSPAGDIVCVFGVRSAAGGASQVLALYSLNGTGKIGDLPTHEKNLQSDDLASQWTPDGRYVCYFDMNEKDGKPVAGTRIWDVTGMKEKAFVEGTAPMGSGPDGSHIWLVRTAKDDNRPILYHADSGRSWELGDASVRLLHGVGEKVAYFKSAANGRKTLCVADLNLP